MKFLYTTDGWMNLDLTLAEGGKNPATLHPLMTQALPGPGTGSGGVGVCILGTAWRL